MELQEQPPYEQLSRPISELDLQALEMLDPDSSSQEENSNDRLEAAVSSSSLSVGLQRADITLNTQNTSRVLSSSSSRGMGPGMLVIMSTQGFRDRGDELETEEQENDDSIAQRSLSLPPMLSQASLEQESRSFELDSSMESEESRQLESFHSVLSEADPCSDHSVTVITSATRTTRQQREEDEEEQEQQRGSNPTSLAGRPSVASAVDSNNNEKFIPLMICFTVLV